MNWTFYLLLFVFRIAHSLWTVEAIFFNQQNLFSVWDILINPTRIVKPKKERLEEALESLRMKQQILAEARAKLRELSEMIARLQREYDEKVAQKEELERRSKMLQLKLERAEALITGLSGKIGTI